MGVKIGSRPKGANRSGPRARKYAQTCANSSDFPDAVPRSGC
ncbi:hypothetical protein BVG79_01118 [Ketogulonicigenium robustum]|uniref:Uncharacterized protein n=1 Tax=Ketogulonicigenium robustum TaxID=92947 RepID=A0A1W6NZ31_9RHOB|nr:hypothetical protein BVG79_01118 [Ketogulonicigenium robustum]